MTEQQAYLVMAFILGFLANHAFTFLVLKALTRGGEPRSKKVDQSG